MKTQKKYKGGLTFIIVIIMLNIIEDLKKIYDTDYFWHLKVGEFIFNNKRIPVNDIFSWYGISHNLDWFSHEWLSEIFLYINYKVFGHTGNIVFVAMSVSLIILTLYITNVDNFFRNIYFSFTWFIIFIVCIGSSAVPRPQIFNFLLMTISLYILNKYREEDTELVWLLPVISILWVNLHGGSSSLLLVLISITILSGLFNFTFFKIKAEKLPMYKIKCLIINLALSIGTAIINPKGIKMLIYPIMNMSDRLMLTTIDEWRCPDLKDIPDLPIFLAIGVVIIIFIIIKEEIDLFDIIISIAFIYLTLKSVRFVALLVIAVTPIVLKYVPKGKDTDIIKVLKYPFILIIIIMAIFNCNIIKSLNKCSIDTKYLPSEKSIEFIKKEKPARMLNSYTWGGYLIYKNIPVFIDGRADLYSKNIYPDYIHIDYIRNDFKSLLNKYEFDVIMYPKDSKLNLYLSDSKDFKLIYSDSITVIYTRVSKR